MDGGAAGGPHGRYGVTGKHDSSERSSPFLMRRGLPLPSATLPPEDLGTTTTPGTMLSKPFYREHGRPQERWRWKSPHVLKTCEKARSLPV